MVGYGDTSTAACTSFWLNRQPWSWFVTWHERTQQCPQGRQGRRAENARKRRTAKEAN